MQVKKQQLGLDMEQRLVPNQERSMSRLYISASWEICMQVKKQQLGLDMEQRLVPNQERSMSRLYMVTLLI